MFQAHPSCENAGVPASAVEVATMMPEDGAVTAASAEVYASSPFLTDIHATPITANATARRRFSKTSSSCRRASGATDAVVHGLAAPLPFSPPREPSRGVLPGAAFLFPPSPLHPNGCHREGTCAMNRHGSVSVCHSGDSTGDSQPSVTSVGGATQIFAAGSALSPRSDAVSGPFLYGHGSAHRTRFSISLYASASASSRSATELPSPTKAFASEGTPLPAGRISQKHRQQLSPARLLPPFSPAATIDGVVVSTTSPNYDSGSGECTEAYASSAASSTMRPCSPSKATNRRRHSHTASPLDSTSDSRKYQKATAHERGHALACTRYGSSDDGARRPSPSSQQRRTPKGGLGDCHENSTTKAMIGNEAASPLSRSAPSSSPSLSSDSNVLMVRATIPHAPCASPMSFELASFNTPPPEEHLRRSSSSSSSSHSAPPQQADDRGPATSAFVDTVGQQVGGAAAARVTPLLVAVPAATTAADARSSTTSPLFPLLPTHSRVNTGLSCSSSSQESFSYTTGCSPSSSSFSAAAVAAGGGDLLRPSRADPAAPLAAEGGGSFGHTRFRPSPAALASRVAHSSFAGVGVLGPSSNHTVTSADMFASIRPPPLPAFSLPHRFPHLHEGSGGGSGVDLSSSSTPVWARTYAGQAASATTAARGAVQLLTSAIGWSWQPSRPHSDGEGTGGKDREELSEVVSPQLPHQWQRQQQHHHHHNHNHSKPVSKDSFSPSFTAASTWQKGTAAKGGVWLPAREADRELRRPSEFAAFTAEELFCPPQAARSPRQPPQRSRSFFSTTPLTPDPEPRSPRTAHRMGCSSGSRESSNASRTDSFCEDHHLADYFSHQLRRLFQNPPSLASAMRADCAAVYLQLQEACGQGIRWGSLVTLLDPEDALSLASTHRSSHLISFEEFVEFIEVASLRHARWHFAR